MNKTAMQTLIDELKDYKRTTHADKLVITFWICMAERLLEKEKQQIIDAHMEGFYSQPFGKSRKGEAEKHYKETFKSE